MTTVCLSSLRTVLTFGASSISIYIADDQKHELVMDSLVSALGEVVPDHDAVVAKAHAAGIEAGTAAALPQDANGTPSGASAWCMLGRFR